MSGIGPLAARRLSSPHVTNSTPLTLLRAYVHNTCHLNTRRLLVHWHLSCARKQPHSWAVRVVEVATAYSPFTFDLCFPTHLAHETRPENSLSYYYPSQHFRGPLLSFCYCYCCVVKLVLLLSSTAAELELTSLPVQQSTTTSRGNNCCSPSRASAVECLRAWYYYCY